MTHFSMTNTAHSVTAKYYVASEGEIAHLPHTYASVEDAARHAHELLNNKYVITSPLRKTVTRDMQVNSERVTLTNYTGEIKHNNLTRRVYVTITSKHV